MDQRSPDEDLDAQASRQAARLAAALQRDLAELNDAPADATLDDGRTVLRDSLSALQQVIDALGARTDT